MNKQQLQDIHNKVWRHFNYVHDDKNYGVMEDWRSHAKAVNEGVQFKDDCDGYAFTMVELMIEAGFPRDKVMFIVCETETGEGHAVSGFEVDGITYIAENRFDYVYDWNSKPRYKWKFFMKFDKPGQWYQVTNDK
jgi:predicted transglutaminase-like cysteine proteinase